MRFVWLPGYACIVLAACGGDGIGVNPGDGSNTLLVVASIDHDGSSADFEVDVRRNGSGVTDARVMIGSDLGDVVVPHIDQGLYEGGHAGWGESYIIDVSAGDDWLDGGIDAPVQAHVIGPDPTVAFDPHTAEDGVVLLTWDGRLAHNVRVRVRDFEWEGPDRGELEIPATVFDDESPELRITRTNTTALEGGLPGSRLEVQVETEVRLIVVNPY